VSAFEGYDKPSPRRFSVCFTNAERTTATVTYRPSWIARLFGERKRVAEVRVESRASYDWAYVVDGTSVKRGLSLLLDEEQRWARQEPLPMAREVRSL
jgi:hypothetical protein